MLIGVFVSAGAKTSQTITDVKPNIPTEAKDMTLEITNLRVVNATSEVYSSQAQHLLPQYSTVTADIIVQQSGATYSGEISASFYPNYGLALTPLIINTATGDMYVHMEIDQELYDILTAQLTGNGTIPTTVSLTAQNIPLVYLVWVGVTLMVVSMVVECVVDLRQTRRQQHGAGQRT